MTAAKEGLQRKKSMEVADMLAVRLADTYLLLIKTQNYHWNVVDANFYSLHKLFETQYEALQEFVDELAERIRMLGCSSPGSMKQFLKLATLREADRMECKAIKALSDLLHDHDLTCTQLRRGIDLSEEFGDEGTADLLIQLLRFHEKALWMLRSQLPK